RDATVTGVQTCALPILAEPSFRGACLSMLWNENNRNRSRACPCSLCSRILETRGSASCRGDHLRSLPMPSSTEVPRGREHLPGPTGLLSPEAWQKRSSERPYLRLESIELLGKSLYEDTPRYHFHCCYLLGFAGLLPAGENHA